MSILREIFFRVVLWQSRTGFVGEAAGQQLLLQTFPSETTERLMVSTGSERPVSRRHQATFLNVESNLQEHLRLMQQMGCPIRFVALAVNRHVLWYEETLMDDKSARQGYGGYAADSLTLSNNVFDSGIHQGADLLSGIPWECTDAVLFSTQDPTVTEIIPGTIGSGETFDPFVLVPSSMPGYIGPVWQADAGDSVDACGVLTTTGIPIVLEMELPIGGATLTATGAQIQYYDFFGNLLKTVADGVSSFVPGLTMFVRLTLSSALTRPTLDVGTPGSVRGPRSGECVVCTSRATVLCDWLSVTDIDPSEWTCPDPDGLICIVVGTNTAPFIFDCPPLAGSGELPSGGACLVDLTADAVLGGDGIWDFSVVVADNDEDPFTISSITFVSALLIVYADGVIEWSIGTLVTDSGRTKRQIDFRVVDSAFGNSDTITFTINADDGAGNTPALTFTMVKGGS